METLRILVVEDEQIISLEIQHRLQELGYQVAGAVSSGQEAIDLTDRERPDLVLVDISLKGEMDGIEAAATIKNDFQIPVVFLTANTDQATFQRAKLTEPYGYLFKPFDGRTLHTTIEIALYKNQVEKKLSKYQQQLEEAIEERDAVISQLNQALEQVKSLSGMLPICASCKKIRDDQGYWQQVERYISQRSEAEFSHAICPACAHKLYPGFDYKG